jgi:DNA-binding HxlR family transcriptional regulator
MSGAKQTPRNIFGPGGTAGDLLEHVSEKWTALIILSLSENGKRPSQLKAELGGISDKVLSQTLRKLQVDGIIERQVQSVVPPKVEYSLTPHGITLTKVFSNLQEWSHSNLNAFVNNSDHQHSNQGLVVQDARHLFERVAEKWTVKVVYELAQETKRFNQLKREIKGCSQKMLTQTLRKLEQDGLLARKEYPEVPPKVEYSLTELGSSLAEQFQLLCNWAETHYDELKKDYNKSKA